MDRNSTIDIIRGSTILLIVLGHLRWLNNLEFITSNAFYYTFIKFLYSFHVNVFFIVGGYLSYQKITTVSFVQFFYKKIIRLLIPFFGALVFYSAFNCILFLLYRFLEQHPLNALPSIKGVCLAFLMGNDDFINKAGIFGHLWFLPAYFMANVFFFLFSRIKNTAISLGCLFLICPVCAWLLIKYIPSKLIPWGVGVALLVMPLMAIGRLQDRIIVQMSRAKSITSVLCIVLPVFMWFASSYNEVVRLSILELPGGIIVFYAFVVFGWFWITSLAVTLEGTLTGMVFSMLGRYSLEIYILHIFVIDIFKLLRIYYCDHFLSFFVGQFLMLLFSLFGPVVISKSIIQKRNILKLLFAGT